MKEFIGKLLNGVSIGIVVALIPNALLGELLKLLIPYFPPLQHLFDITVFTMSLLPVMIGVMVGVSFKLSSIQTASVGIASMVGSGVVQKTAEGVMTLNGIGIVLNISITAALTVLFVQLLGNKLKAYEILLMPTLSIMIPGMIGYLLLPFMKQSTGIIGSLIAQITLLQPILMGSLIAMIFCIIILLPVSTVGVATVIMLSGVGAGAANLGIVAAGIGLAISSYKANSFGTALAHVLGSPKIQMKNFLLKPQIATPMLITAGVLGALAGFLNIQGTPYSAGFGLSGLVGPMNYMNLAEGGWNGRNVAIMLSTFLVVAVLLNIGLLYIFTRKLKIIKATDYKLDFE